MPLISSSLDQKLYRIRAPIPSYYQALLEFKKYWNWSLNLHFKSYIVLTYIAICMRTRSDTPTLDSGRATDMTPSENTAKMTNTRQALKNAMLDFTESIEAKFSLAYGSLLVWVYCMVLVFKRMKSESKMTGSFIYCSMHSSCCTFWVIYVPCTLSSSLSTASFYIVFYLNGRKISQKLGSIIKSVDKMHVEISPRQKTYWK